MLLRTLFVYLSLELFCSALLGALCLAQNGTPTQQQHLDLAAFEQQLAKLPTPRVLRQLDSLGFSQNEAQLPIGHFMLKKIELLLRYQEEDRFYNYQHTPSEVLQFYSLLQIETHVCLQQARQLQPQVPYMSEQYRYLSQSINYFKRQLTYCDLRIDNVFALSPTPTYLQYKQQKVYLSSPITGQIVSPNHFVSTYQSNHLDNTFFLTGYRSGIQRTAFVAKVNSGQIEWLKEIAPSMDWEYAGTFVEEQGPSIISKIRCIPLNPATKSQEMICQFSSTGEKTAEITLEHNIDGTDLLMLKNKEPLTGFLSGKGGQHTTSQITAYEYLHLSSFSALGEIEWEKSIRLEGDVVACLQNQRDYILLCNSAYGGNSIPSSPQTFHSSVSSLPSTLVIVRVSKQDGHITYEQPFEQLPLRITHTLPLPDNSLLISGKKADYTQSTFSLLLSSNGELMASKI